MTEKMFAPKPARLLPFGARKRIAEAAKVSQSTVTAVFASRLGISNGMRLHVANVAAIVLAAMRGEREAADQALAALSL